MGTARASVPARDCAATGLSRNTIKKYLRADVVEPRYAKRVSPSKLDPFADKLASWLKTETGKSRKQRRTVKQMHADLAALGYDGSYNRVAAFARDWQAKRQEAERTTGRGTFVPLVFGAGEAFQFDWSEDWAVVAGERTKLQVAHTKLPGTVADVWMQERALLMPLPRPFDGFVEYTKRVSPTCLVTFERVRYSVPASFANRPVSLRVYAQRIVVAAEGQLLCEHPRVIDRRHDSAGHTVYDWRHYLPTLLRSMPDRVALRMSSACGRARASDNSR